MVPFCCKTSYSSVKWNLYKIKFSVSIFREKTLQLSMNSSKKKSGLKIEICSRGGSTSNQPSCADSADEHLE
jgi:hypothetical protein